MDNSLVQHLFHNFYQLFPNAGSIAIADMEKFIYYEPCVDVDLKIRPGDKLHSETVTYLAITKKKKVRAHKENNLFGVSYFAISQPIVDQKKIVGAMTAIYPHKPQSLSVPFLTVRTSDRWVPIHFDEIISLEAQNRKTLVTSSHVKGYHRNNLSELEMLIPNSIFIRCHRSYIVNLHKIKEVHPDSHSTFVLIMADDSRLPVSQSYAKQIRNILGF